MHWPSVSHIFSTNKKVDYAQIARDTIMQVTKDFMLQGFDIKTMSESSDYNEIVSYLAQQLEEIKFIEDSRLPALLYQLDLNEGKIRGDLTSTDPSNIYSVLADAIIKKCFEKVCWRHQFKA